MAMCFLPNATVGCCRVLECAHGEAKRAGSSYIGTEHILLGILSELEYPGVEVLRRLGVDLKVAKELALKSILSMSSEELEFNAGAKKVLEFARDECRRMGCTDVGIAHLVLGLVREGWGVGSMVLTSRFDVTLEVARETVLDLNPEEP